MGALTITQYCDIKLVINNNAGCDVSFLHFIFNAFSNYFMMSKDPTELSTEYLISFESTRFVCSGCFIQYSYSKWRLKAMRNEMKSSVRAV